MLDSKFVHFLSLIDNGLTEEAIKMVKKDYSSPVKSEIRDIVISDDKDSFVRLREVLSEEFIEDLISSIGFSEIMKLHIENNHPGDFSKGSLGEILLDYKKKDERYLLKYLDSIKSNWPRSSTENKEIFESIFNNIEVIVNNNPKELKESNTIGLPYLIESIANKLNDLPKHDEWRGFLYKTYSFLFSRGINKYVETKNNYPLFMSLSLLDDNMSQWRFFCNQNNIDVNHVDSKGRNLLFKYIDLVSIIESGQPPKKSKAVMDYFKCFYNNEINLHQINNDGEGLIDYVKRKIDDPLYQDALIMEIQSAMDKERLLERQIFEEDNLSECLPRF